MEVWNPTAADPNTGPLDVFPLSDAILVNILDWTCATLGRRGRVRKWNYGDCDLDGRLAPGFMPMEAFYLCE